MDTNLKAESFEPPPAVQTNATLLFGKTEVPCYVVEDAITEFRVYVPGIERYEGDPKLTLITKDFVYSVRLTLQEPRTRGFSFQLKRLDRGTPRQKIRTSEKVPVGQLASRYCGTGLVAAVMAGCLCVPSANDAVPLRRLQVQALEVLGWNAAKIRTNDGEHGRIDAKNAIVLNPILDHESSETNEDLWVDSFSMISTVSMSASTGLIRQDGRRCEAEEDAFPDDQNGGKTPLLSKREYSLKSLLQKGLVGRTQNLDNSKVDWLFESQRSRTRLALRVSAAALVDLEQFEQALQCFSKELSLRAINSLHRTLSLAIANSKNGRCVAGVPDVFVVPSDIANVYFRTVNGRAELIRVLPLDFSKADRS